MSEQDTTDTVELAAAPVVEGETQTADTPGNDENGDGVSGGQATADTVGDILGI